MRILLLILVLFVYGIAGAQNKLKDKIDFNKVVVKELGNTVQLIDTSGGSEKNITPMATINRVEELNKEKNYALVYCLNRYFYINELGEMSAGFEKYPDYYIPDGELIFGSKLKRQKANGLYNFRGVEVGEMSKSKLSYVEYDMETQEPYFLFINSKKQRGLMNKKGKLVLECKYLDIGTISGAKCDVWLKKGEEPVKMDLSAKD